MAIFAAAEPIFVRARDDLPTCLFEEPWGGHLWSIDLMVDTGADIGQLGRLKVRIPLADVEMSGRRAGAVTGLHEARPRWAPSVGVVAPVFEQPPCARDCGCPNCLEVPTLL